jgi:hypothetical protein
LNESLGDTLADIGYFDDYYFKCGGTIGLDIMFFLFTELDAALSLYESAEPNWNPLEIDDAGLTQALAVGVANFLLFFSTTDGGRF